jgi:hypothetical protein
MTRTALSLILIASTGACGGAVQPDGASSGGSGGPESSVGHQPSRGGSAGTGGLPATGGQGGGPGGSTGIDAGSAGAPGCYRSDASFGIFRVIEPGGNLLDCSAGSPASTKRRLVGTSLGSMGDGRSGSVFEIDTCPPYADCDASVWIFQLDFGPHALRAPAGELVAVDFDVEVTPFGTCRQRIVMRSVSSWDADPAGGDLTLIATDGFMRTDAGLYELVSTPLGCGWSGLACGIAADAYALELRAQGAPGTTLFMGEKPLYYGYAGTQYQLANLRSYTTGACEATEFAYFMFDTSWEYP